MLIVSLITVDRARQSVRQSLRRKGPARNSSVKSKQGTESSLPTIPAGVVASPSEIVIESKVQIQSPPSGEEKHSESRTDVAGRTTATPSWQRGEALRRSTSRPPLCSQLPSSTSTTFPPTGTGQGVDRAAVIRYVGCMNIDLLTLNETFRFKTLFDHTLVTQFQSEVGRSLPVRKSFQNLY